MAEKENINVGKIAIKLLSQLAFATLFLVAVPIFIINKDNNFHYYLFTTDVFNSSSWFVGYYFLVILFGALFLNKYLKNLSRESYLTLLLALLAVISFSWSRSVVDNIAGGFATLILGTFLYSLGGYIKKYNPFENIHAWVLLVSILLVYIFIWVSEYNNMNLRIDEYLKNGSTNEFIHTVIGFGNHSIVVIALSILIFELFRRIPVFHSKIINYASSATFMAYLLHDNSLFYQRWNKKDWIILLMNSPFEYLLHFAKWTFAVFFLGVAVYSTYLFLKVLLSKYKHIFIKNN